MKILSFVLLTLFTNPADTEVLENSAFDLSGQVIEETTGEPLTGAVVHIEGIGKEYYTDFDGYFNIESLRPGTYNIEISYVSFESSELKRIYLDKENNNLFVGLR